MSFVSAEKLTPEEKLERALALAQATNPKLPEHMAPGAMDPKRFQSIQDKRKLLWGKKKVYMYVLQRG